MAITNVYETEKKPSAIIGHKCTLKEGMELEKYLEKENLSIGKFAKRAKTSKSAIANYVHKKRVPVLDIALRIVEASYGEVSLRDLIHK